MKYIITLAFLMTCTTPQLTIKTNLDAPNISNKINIKGDSNNIEINYYWYLNDTINRADTL